MRNSCKNLVFYQDIVPSELGLLDDGTEGSYHPDSGDPRCQKGQNKDGDDAQAAIGQFGGETGYSGYGVFTKKFVDR